MGPNRPIFCGDSSSELTKSVFIQTRHALSSLPTLAGRSSRCPFATHLLIGPGSEEILSKSFGVKEESQKVSEMKGCFSERSYNIYNSYH